MIKEQWNSSIFFVVYFLRVFNFSLIYQNIVINMLYFATVSKVVITNTDNCGLQEYFKRGMLAV